MVTRSTKGRRTLPKSISLKGAAWQLQTAKVRFSEVFRLALASGPQIITRGGREAVVVYRPPSLKHSSHGPSNRTVSLNSLSALHWRGAALL